MGKKSRLGLFWSLLLGVCGGVAACGDSPVARPDGEDLAPIAAPQRSTVSVTDVADSTPTAAIADDAEPGFGDTTIIPGERFGPVTLGTSRADLVDWFGAEAVVDVEVPAGEGTTEPGTQVDLGPEQSFSVVWLDDAQTRPLLVKDFGAAWRTKDGIGLHMTVADLQAVLGPFEFYGFGWDYGGTVILEGTSLNDAYGVLIIRLQPDIGSNEIPPESLQAVMGDGIFSSETVNLADLGVTVGEMIVYLNDSP